MAQTYHGTIKGHLNTKTIDLGVLSATEAEIELFEEYDDNTSFYGELIDYSIFIPTT